MEQDMKYFSGICSDVGIRKKVNQDAAMICQADTRMGNVMLAVVCDGMGGLEKGELASSTVINGMAEWFEETFSHILYHDFTTNAIKDSWMHVIMTMNEQIQEYGKQHGIQLGTTMAALLLVQDSYYICNIGDSRIYYLKNQVDQVTRDQSYVQQEVDMGRMTEEEALHSDKRNLLLQCIGAGDQVEPDFYFGEYQNNSAFLLCSDGFWHELELREIWEALQPDFLVDQADIEEKVQKLIDLAKDRQERDNITAVLVCAK